MLNFYNFASFGNIIIFTNYYNGFNIHLHVIKVNSNPAIYSQEY